MKIFKGASWPLFFAFFLLTSCGTIRSKKNIIFADSEPRGLIVKNEKGEELGVTPFFFKVNPGDKRKFSFLYKEKFIGDESYRCKWDWGGSVVPNALWAPLYPVGTILSGIFFTADATTRGLYVCKDSVLLKSSLEKKNIEKKIVIIGMPIAIGQSVLAEKAIGFWRENIFEKHKKDEEFLWNQSIEDEFVYRGVDLYADTNPTKIKRRFINQVGHKFNGTHFLHFEVKEEDKYFSFKPVLYDAFTFKQIEAPYLKPFKMKKEVKTSKNYWKRILRNIDLLPNAVTISHHTQPVEKRDVQATSGQSGQFHTNNHPSAFPKLVTMFGVESVRHPQFFSNWDWGGFLSPHFGASSWRSSFPIASETYDFDFQSYYLGYNATLTGFSPLGQITVGIGINASYVILNDSRGLNEAKVAPMIVYLMNYKKFFNDRFYFTFGTKFFDVDNSVTGKLEYTLKNWNEAYVGLGYYFPEVKTFARRLLGL